jgi:dTMP kinase
METNMTARNPRLKVYSVSLVGMDGSGKSTQAQRLLDALRKQNAQVVAIHPFGWKSLAFFARLFRSRMETPSGEKLNGHRQHNLFWRIISWLEVADIALYVWFHYLRSLAAAVFTGQQVWLVSDRSFDDLLIKLQQRKTLSPAAAQAVRGLVPQSDTTFWLQTDPAVARQRDHEFPDDYYSELQTCYLATARKFGWRVIETSQRSPEAIFADIQAELQGKEDA